MSLEDDLVAAIAADPDDVGAQLVTADWLLELGDARGELIILDHRERTTPGGMIDPALIDRLLLLAAQYGFPCAHPPGPVMLSFSGGGSNPVRYAAYLAGRSYHIHYHYFRLSISIDTIGPMVGYPVRFVRDLETAEPGAWTDEEKLVILTLLSEAIRADTPLPDLCFPYSGVRLPVHEDAPLRAYALPVEFTAPRGLAPPSVRPRGPRSSALARTLAQAARGLAENRIAERLVPRIRRELLGHVAIAS